MSQKDNVRIVEVGPRDGLQNIHTTVPTTQKIELIQRLVSSGLRTVELTSIVSRRAVPQLSDNRSVLSDPTIEKFIQDRSLRCPVLIPNQKGLEIAEKSGVKEVAVFVSAAEGFSKANINCSVQEGLDRARLVAHSARKYGMAVRGYISCIFACPFDGPTPVSSVIDCVKQLQAMGCYEISLGDTVGVGTASNVERLLHELSQAGIGFDCLAVHFHDTYGQALANVWAAYQCGIRVFDSSVAGLGGCPFAPGAKGNVATEDVVYMFHQAGVNTGVNLQRLVETGDWISVLLGKENGSRTGTAILSKQRKPSSSPAQGQQQATSKTTWAPFSSSEGLEVSRSGTNLRVELNRPRNGNALTVTMITELTKLFKDIAADSTITRVAICARGKYFCTGMDLGKGTSPVGQGGATSDAQYKRLTGLLEAIDMAPQVTIACVQGPAFGGGVGLAFACDVRIFADSATMILSETSLGLCPATISKYIVREWGPAFAREAMLFARPVPAAELHRLGLVAQIVVGGDSAVLEALDLLLTRLRHSSPRGSAMCKELVKLGSSSVDQSSEQAQGIRALFDEMMAPSGEGAYGVKRRQAGEKKIDWDDYALAKAQPKARL